MMLSEYTDARAEALRRLCIPDTEIPFRLQTLWFEVLCENSAEKRIYKDTHLHSCFEVHFVFSGEVRYALGEQSFCVSAGEAIFIPPDTPHKYLGYSLPLCKASFAFSLGSDAPNLSQVPVQKLSLPDTVTRCFDEILRRAEGTDAFVPYVIGGRVFEILLELVRALGVPLPLSQREQDARVFAAKEYIAQNMHRLIGCEEVAKACFLSSKQMSRLFRAEEGMSLFDYITYARLAYAKRLLSMSEHSVKEIGYLLGFESESSFVSFFKRGCGVSPGRYRADVQK